jgi:basic membrane lipoprotein Med (substrate-binding protein (PBP1-ABC) superfamily)
MGRTHGARRSLSTRVHSAVLLALVAAGCSGDSRDTGGGGDEFRVALLTPGPISDRSWNGGAYNGLLRIRDSLGAAISHIQTKTPAEFDENFRQYGAQGYDLVFGHGFEFQEAALRVAPLYPSTVFVTTSGNTVRDNVAGMVFNMEDASYLAGVIAAHRTRSGTIAAIGGTEFPPVKSSFDAFEAGVRATNPRARVLTAYLGTWDDASAGKEQALALIDRGADVIFQNADAAGLGIFTAARERRGIYVFGTNSNQNDVAPDVILASVVIDLPHALLSVAREVKDGRFKGRVIRLGGAEDVVDLIVNPVLADSVPPPARAAVDSIQRLMLDGRFSAPRHAFKDSTASPT